MIDMIKTRMSFNTIGSAAKDEDFLLWQDIRRDRLEDRYAEYEQSTDTIDNEQKLSFTDWCLMRHLEYIENRGFEKIKKPIMMVDQEAWEEWFLRGNDSCQCAHFIERGTIQQLMETSGYIRFDHITNLDQLELNEDEKDTEEIESPGERYQMVFQEYIFKVK